MQAGVVADVDRREPQVAVSGGVESVVYSVGNGVVDDLDGFGRRADRGEYPACDAGVHAADEGVEHSEADMTIDAG